MKTLYPFFIIFLLCSVGAGCSEKQKHDDKFYYPQGHVYIDTVIPVPLVPIAPMEHGFNRYFYITYQTSLKDNSAYSYGEVWFSCEGFPRKTVIDSNVFSHLEYTRNCYQSLVLTSIYEFKNRGDYNSFAENYKGESAPKHKKICGNNLFKPTVRNFKSDSVFTIQLWDGTTPIKADSIKNY